MKKGLFFIRAESAYYVTH